jgi:ornithine carbamoyltransferase
MDVPRAVFVPRTPGDGLVGADVVSLAHFRRDEIARVLATARTVKADPRGHARRLEGRSGIMLFEKPSLRTRVSFQVGVARLGGTTVYMDHATQRLGERESVYDYGKNLERWVDVIIARVYSQRVIEEMAAASRVPVINALSDVHHPCQALADVMTIAEHRRAGRADALAGVKVVYVGDGNNVCHSLMHACSMLGATVVAITPKGYEPSAEVVRECEAFARESGGRVEVTASLAAVERADAVYTDVWLSMGQADASGKRLRAFAPYRVDADLMARASAGADAPALFMHCLPANRGVEVTDEVIDAPTSVVFDQAENRMWAQNGLLLEVLGA